MQARLRAVPAWVVVLTFDLALGIASVAFGHGGFGRSLEGGAQETIGLAIFLAFVAVLFVRRDGDGWGIWGTVFVPGFLLRLVDWPSGVEFALFVVVTTGLAWIFYDAPD